MNKTTEELFEEYGQNYAIALDPQTTLPKRNQCSINCEQLTSQITKQIQSDVLRDVMEFELSDDETDYRFVPSKDIKSLAESKGLNLN